MAPVLDKEAAVNPYAPPRTAADVRPRLAGGLVLAGLVVYVTLEAAAAIFGARMMGAIGRAERSAPG
jgi:hypothetical protein